MFNAPFSNTRSVAELVLGETLLLLRGIPEKSAKAHRGEWHKSAVGSVEARGKTLGIVGYGHIGMQLGILAETLGMRVRFYDIETKLPLGNASQAFSLPALLKEADVVSLHVPETVQTQNMMGHLVCCYVCAKIWWKRNSNCPVCRRKVEQIIKIIQA